MSDLRAKRVETADGGLDILIEMSATNADRGYAPSVKSLQRRHDESAVSLRLGGWSADHTVQTR
jgi:hypothetical protein